MATVSSGSDFGPDDSEEEPLDVTLDFEDLGPGKESKGWPEDYIGPEIQTVLQTLEPGCRAGKSYRPDPSGNRRAVKAQSYRAGTKFFATQYIIDGLKDLYALLDKFASDPTAFLIRGVLAPWAGVGRKLRRTGEYGYETVRRLVSIHGYGGAFEGERRQLLMIDIDGASLPAGFNVVADPQTCVEWAIEELLPPEFGDVSFIYQLSSSAGLTYPDDELRVHLWFFTERPFWDEEFRDWAHWWNAKQQNKIVDPALYNPVQPHYVNDPELLDGLVDPLAGRRLALVQRVWNTVRLYMPTPAEVAEQVRLRDRRAETAARRAYKAGVTDNRSTEDRPEEPERSGSGATYTRFGAVRDGPGYLGYLRMIGFEGHIRTQILAAVGSYFYDQGSRADRRVIKEAIRNAIEDVPFLDCDEPWSRTRRDALGYLAGDSDSSNVDDMIADIARYQAARETRAFQVCEPSWPLPTLTADEAFSQIDDLATSFVVSAFTLRQDRLENFGNPDASLIETFDVFEPPPQRAALCEPGVGKTEAVINSCLAFLWVDPGARVLVAVPTHGLGQGLAARINKGWGEEIALEWNGIDQPDPQHPEEKMCRRADAAAELFAVGGQLQLLCSSLMSHCPHHPATAGSAACGYQRQQLEARQKARVVIIPATMLTGAPPPALRRSNRSALGDFDLLVIDEGPWLGFLGGHDAEPQGAAVTWLDPRWWAEQETRARGEDRAFAIETLSRLHHLCNDRAFGEISQEVLREAGLRWPDLTRARRILWRWKQNLRPLVKPGASRGAVTRALARVAEINRRVLAIANILDKVAWSLRGDLAPSSLELLEHPKPGGRFLRTRRRRPIHSAWLQAPVLYLDAAGTGAFDLAQAWLPRIELAVEARAKSPHMRITQITDTPMGYGKILPNGSSAQDATAERNAEKLARVIEVIGSGGLVVCPKELRQTWEKNGRLPDWNLWNFGSVRGRDEARRVHDLVVVSRPLPGPGVVELMAETIFGRRVQRVPPEEWYGRSPIGRLMADGTGRLCLGCRHPDPQVEVIRFALCEGELLQAIGRGRGVRRGEEDPLVVFLLTDVPLPVPVTNLTTWKELTDDAGPVEVLAARGVIPLDYRGMATALPQWFTDESAAREWFRYRPSAFSQLRELRAKAKVGGLIDINEFRGNSYMDIFIGNSPKLSVFRYRRTEDRESSLVLVNESMHGDARAAVEVVFARIEMFRSV